MPGINNLSVVSELQGSDLIPIFNTSNGSPRSVSAATAREFFQGGETLQTFANLASANLAIGDIGEDEYVLIINDETPAQTYTNHITLRQNQGNVLVFIRDVEQIRSDLLNSANGFGADLVANAVRKFENIAGMTAATGLTDGQRISVTHYHGTAATLVPDGGGGKFVYRATSAATVDNFLVFAATGMGGVGRIHRILNEIANVKMAGARGDGITNDAAAVQLAMNTVRRLRAPAGDYLLGATPLKVPSFLVMEGDSQTTTRFLKTLAGTGVDGFDAVFTCDGAQRFALRQMTVQGNRTDFASGNVVTSNGIDFRGANYFELSDIRAQDCDFGFRFNISFIGSIDRCVALRTQNYGFRTENACTTLTFRDCVAFGTGGAFSISSTIYSSIINSACDLSDYGGKPGDPFLPQGSGGNHLAPKFIFEVIASRIAIIAPGTENGASQYLYAEGAFIDLINPFIFNLEAFSTTYRAIQLRGIGVSNVNLSNPRFGTITNTLAAATTRNALFIETPRVQKLKTSSALDFNTSWGDFKFNSGVTDESLIIDHLELPINFRQSTMVVGAGTPFIGSPANIQSSIVDVGGTKFVQINNQTTATQFLSIPVANNTGVYVSATGNHTSSFDVFRIEIVTDDGTTVTVLKTYSLTGNFNVFDTFSLNTTLPVFVRLRQRHNTDVSRFSKLLVGNLR